MRLSPGLEENVSSFEVDEQLALVWIGLLRLVPRLQEQVAGVKEVIILGWASGLGLCRRVEVCCSSRIAGCS